MKAAAFSAVRIHLSWPSAFSKNPRVRHTRHHIVVLVTAPDLKTAKELASSVLKARLAACANVIPKVESFFWWEDKLQKADEAQIVFKTTTARIAELEKLIGEAHPYDTPEFLVLPTLGGSGDYLDWIDASTRPEAKEE